MTKAIAVIILFLISINCGWTKTDEIKTRKEEAYLQYKTGIEYWHKNKEKKALSLLEKSANNGYIPAYETLGDLDRAQLYDPEKAVYWYQKGADLGSARAQALLGHCYEEGMGVQQNYKTAFFWYQKSAEQGSDEGMMCFARCYDKGIGVTTDYEKAVYWYQKCAEKGDKHAQKKVEEITKLLANNSNTTNSTNNHTINNAVTAATTKEPSLVWQNFQPQVTQKEYTLEVGVKSESKVEETTVEVNGQKYRGMSTVGNDGYTMTVSQKVTLREGENTIRVTARNAGGTSVSEKTVTYRPEVVSAPVEKGKRIALIMGNADYAGLNKLENPANDAQDIAAKLKSLGFETMLMLNKNRKGMHSAIEEFSNKATNYDTWLSFTMQATAYNITGKTI